jgi:predicted CoA-binding protein
VYVKGGPEPDAFSLREIHDGQSRARQLGHAPARVDVVYCHRPLDELPAIVAMAAELRAGALWYQSGSTPDGAREPTACWLSAEDAGYVHALAESAGLDAVTDDYIADIARRIQAGIARPGQTPSS